MVSYLLRRWTGSCEPTQSGDEGVNSRMNLRMQHKRHLQILVSLPCLSICLGVIPTEEAQCSSEDLIKCLADMKNDLGASLRNNTMCDPTLRRWRSAEWRGDEYERIPIMVLRPCSSMQEWSYLSFLATKEKKQHGQMDDGWGPDTNRMINNLHLWDKAIRGNTKHLPSQQKPNLTQTSLNQPKT